MFDKSIPRLIKALILSEVEGRRLAAYRQPPRGSTSLTMRMIGVLISISALSAVAAAQTLFPLPPQPEGLAWPTDGWEMGELPPDIAADVHALVDDMMSRELSDEMGETRAIVIIHHGKLVLETYREGFGPDTKQVSWSMAKSVTSALVGRAVQLGLIADIDAPMPSPFAADDPRAAITWRQWLTMTDGLDYTEIGAASMDENDVIQMTYGLGRFNVISYAVENFPLKHEPGTHWNYSTAGFHLIAWALQYFSADQVNRQLCNQIGNESSIAEFQCQQRLTASYISTPPASVLRARHWAYRMDGLGLLAGLGLFDPLGMDAQPEFDAAGNFLGGSLVWASARDFAKFGYLHLRDGVWEGQRLLPESWVDFARTGAQDDDSNVYGGGWWITTYGEDPVPDSQRRNAPPWDAFSAEGHEGQTLHIVPSRDLVIVRLGLMDNGGNNWPALFQWNQKLASLFPETRFASNSDEVPGLSGQ